MTTNIDTLSAGRELDALVAEKVMGWTIYDDGIMDQGAKGRTWASEWHPSTDIAAAWEVVEKVQQATGCSAVVQKHARAYECWFIGSGQKETQWADTAPLAICRAALKAVGA
jgi:hypothetical protein